MLKVEPNKIKIGLCGVGTVGKGVVDLLKSNGSYIAKRTGFDIQIKHLGMRTPKSGIDTSGCKVSNNLLDVACDPDLDIVVELIGGDDLAKDLAYKVLSEGKHLVTANKALIAGHGDAILNKACELGLIVAFEASVASGIPVIKMIREGLVANRITAIKGIINGTTNYILDRMKVTRRDFFEVLKEAQSAGYAEADPKFDIEGIDAAHKLAILAAQSFQIPYIFEQIHIEGITSISLRDIDYADELGYNIKHLAVAEKCGYNYRLGVYPAMLKKARLMARIPLEMNAVQVLSEPTGESIFYGAGAGGAPTASAVVADILDIARKISSGDTIYPENQFMQQSSAKITDFQILPVVDKVRNYLRISVNGAVSEEAFKSILTANKIVIESMNIKTNPEHKINDLIIVVSPTQETTINKAVRILLDTPNLCSDLIRIRISDS